MKKFIFVVGLIALMSGVASAHTQVDEFGMPVAHTHPTNQNPLAVFQPAFGMTGIEIIARGWVLKAGEGDCPLWYGRIGCWSKR